MQPFGLWHRQLGRQRPARGIGRVSPPRRLGAGVYPGFNPGFNSYLRFGPWRGRRLQPEGLQADVDRLLDPALSPAFPRRGVCLLPLSRGAVGGRIARAALVQPFDVKSVPELLQLENERGALRSRPIVDGVIDLAHGFVEIRRLMFLNHG
jgi:hypothetical protein